MATLVVKAPDGSERRVTLSRRLTSVGRDPENDVAVPDPTLPATALHLHFDGRDWDAAAHDGAAMTVNGRSRGACRLGPGDRIRVGATELLFDPAARLEPPAPAATSALDGRLAREALVRFSERLLGATDLPRLLDELLDAVVEVTQADKGFLILLQEGEMTVRAARNVARETIEGAVSRVSDTIVRRVVETGRALVVADALHDAEWSGSSSVVNLKLCSVMCAPLKSKGEVFGVLYLGNDNVVSLFDQRALEVLTVFAAQASLLLQNGLLLDSLRRENVALREAVTTRHYGDLIGSGASMREVFRRIEKVASTDISVLVTGETGSGKEVVARELHRRSPRSAGPFVAVNCGAIPESLLESELFGHVKGAFTGAVAARQGRFQAAAGGTLFLDEIGEMPPGLQVKILRALQERAVTRVGESRPEPVDLRVVAATNRVLEQEIARGTFREDLYYRLNVVAIHLPPLRERGEDVVVLARWFLQQYAREYAARVKGFTPGALVAMKKYAWPGNVRELENRVKKAVVLADRAVVSAEDLDLSPEVLEPTVPLALATRDFQRRYVGEVLDRNGGNRTKTAKDLGVDPRTIFRHLERMEAERRGEPLPPEEESP
ncbi:MAG: sigma 54-interacting transcriptional regulator [Anaeromyxobacter sp.]|nr:sigma 54-interacting transcriptional regulator [Anaeromyxobacter sp.]MBL0277961.1 sigma 54-interacting transcriptional regulator [Anaeromyxobacter sp.]